VKPVFANSAFVDVPERLVLKNGGWHKIRLKVRYGIVRHPEAGIILIDTGYGPRVKYGPRCMALRLYNSILGLTLVEDGQPEAALRQFGATLQDVRVVVDTHFHADHISALDLFPHAQIYTSLSAFQRIKARSRLRNLRHGVFTELLPASFAERVIDVDTLARLEAPLGLGDGADLLGDGSLLAIDLPGHGEGHFGVCFPKLHPPLLYAVDVQWIASAMLESRGSGFPASLVATDSQAQASSIRRVAAFRDMGGDVVLCHDPLDSPYDMLSDPP
jgi:glyoxylase-like metal-dependent hydrolase (beta-lactamase superfamily II)